MPSQISPSVEARDDLVRLVRDADRTLMPMLLERSQAARALWDSAPDGRNRDVLTLFLTDPWGSAVGDFAPGDLREEATLQGRVRDLLGEMVAPGRPRQARIGVELRDAFVPTAQLDQLRQRLGQVPGIGSARLRLRNQVRFLPQKPDNYLLTDFVIEVDEPFAAAVRRVVQECGFRLRDDPPLIGREGVRDALIRLVERHGRDGQPPPDFAACFRLQDRETIHLLEVSGQAPEMEDGDLYGVGFSARGVVPHAYSVKIYLVHPNDLLLASRANPDHPAFHDLRAGACDFLLPDDGGEGFRRRFPQLMGP